MNTKKISLIIVTLLFLQFFVGIGSAEPMSFRGYVYYDTELIQPDEVIAHIEGLNYEANVSTGIFGYYAFDFDGSIGDEVIFDVVYEGYTYEAVRTHTIDKHINKNFNLTIDSSENRPPQKPSSENPSDDATGQNINVDLSWSCSDPDGDNITYTIFFGTDDTPSQVADDYDSTTYDLEELNYETMYYWKIVATDEHDASSEGPVWNFKTKKEPTTPGPGPSPGPSPGPITDGDDTASPGDNAKPTAVATVNMNTGSPGTEFSFDASDSSDPEGTDLNFTWDFDDGSIGHGETITHTFTSTGTYEVMLTVEDAGGLTDSLDEPLIIEIIVGNNPPTDVTITPDTTQTSVDTNVTFTISATDPDENDTIEYTINWDDTNSMTSERYNSTESFEATHKWETYGVYDVTVTAKDEQNATDETTATVWVDVYVIDDEINGWLIDTNSDGIFDTFRNTETDQETDVEEQKENVYLIDADDDGTWDYTFNTETDTLKAYSTDQDDGLNLAVYVLVGLIILLIIVFGYLTYKNKQQQEKKQRQQKQEKKSSSKKSSKKSQSKKSKK